MVKQSNSPDAVLDNAPFDIKLEGIKIIKEVINIPETFSYDNDKKKLEANLSITIKIKEQDPTISSNRELIEVCVGFNSFLKDFRIVEFEALNIFSISNNKLFKLLSKPNVNDSVISFIISNSIAQTRGIYQMKIADTKIHRVSIPLVTLRDLKEMVSKSDQKPNLPIRKSKE